MSTDQHHYKDVIFKVKYNWYEILVNKGIVAFPSTEDVDIFSF